MAQIRVGRPDVEPDTPSHTKGVRMGNEKGGYEKQTGHSRDGTADARRSTGVSPGKRNPLLRVMPNLPPG